MAKISIVIPTHNHCSDLLKPCLESIVQYTDSSVEVIVVANGCVDETRQYVEGLGKQFTLIWHEEGLGYTKATNIGIKAATGDYIVLLNNDVVLLPQDTNLWLNKLLEPFVDESVGLTGVHKKFSEETNSDFFCFYCVMIPRVIFSKLGLLDEIFSPGFGEDMDYCKKIEIAGYRLVDCETNKAFNGQLMVGDFPIYHPGSSTFHDSEHANTYERIVRRNQLLLRHKYLGEKLKLNMGSGGVSIDGYLGIDLYDNNSDFKFDMKCLPFLNESVSEIVSYHSLEHINPYEANEVLDEWHRLLIPGGKLIIEMPDISEIFRNFELANKLQRYRLLNIVYGCGEYLGHHHYWGWYDEILIDHLLQHGFVNCVRKEPQTHLTPGEEHYSMRIEANKAEFSQMQVPDSSIVSIIVPTYKRHNMLREALVSILAQTYKKIKVLVVSDGPDECVRNIVDEFNKLEINDEFNHISFEYLCLKEHEGALGGRVRILGIDSLPEHGYVCFLDDDNILYPTYVEKLHKVASGISYCQINHSHIDHPIPLNGEIKLGEVDSLNYMVPNAVAKKCKDKWIHDPNNIVTHDFDFIKACLQHTNSVFVPEILAEHRRTESGYTEESPKVYDKLLDHFLQQDELTYLSIFDWNGYGVLDGELKNKLVLDIGGNKGYFSVFSALNGARQCYCFEPNATSYLLLLENTKTFLNITPINCAVSKPGISQAHISKEGWECQVQESGDGELVNCVSLDYFLKYLPLNEDLVMKIDCEGSEYDIIFNCSLDNLRRFKYIYSEIHNNLHMNSDYNYDMFEKFMNDNGFSSEEVIPNTQVVVGVWYYQDGKPINFVPSENPGNKILKFTRIDTPKVC